MNAREGKVREGKVNVHSRPVGMPWARVAIGVVALVAFGLVSRYDVATAQSPSLEVFTHEAPLWPKSGGVDTSLPLSVEVASAERVRVLVHHAPHGIHTVELSRRGDRFIGEIPVDATGTPWLRYRFQALTARGELLESSVYTVWRPMTDPVTAELQERARALDLRVRVLSEHLRAADGAIASPSQKSSLASLRLKLIDLLRRLRGARGPQGGKGEG